MEGCRGFYVPRIVAQPAELLRSKVKQYIFVSSISAYADFMDTGKTEKASLARLEDEDSEDAAAHYGALKAKCEQGWLKAGHQAFTMQWVRKLDCNGP
ncbi:MAG: dependent epimerase/dehydratase family [Paenibacillaceae bacterium]|nr:dependent epimerase/dehydratase family [Paenibacillaceae bacterium]